jgi:hypothetical protein
MYHFDIVENCFILNSITPSQLVYIKKFSILNIIIPMTHKLTKVGEITKFLKQKVQ